ncbi:hypothetical protein ACJMK2_043690 [Sinanodonta woodiana]|uniref:Glycosyltransferase family 92 protein n=1 Tax=Sinanodonta woodiana TaxID=1069815 RepID=A0ABD3VZG4_SINWO
MQTVKQEISINDAQAVAVSNAGLLNMTISRLQNNTQATKAPKYYLTEVVRVRLYKEDNARWTIKEFKQWVHYMFYAGVDHIFVCNHYLDESEKIESYLQKYVEKGLMTVIPWTFRNPRKGQEDYVTRIHDNQMGCYNYFLMGNGSDTVWQMSIDMDEYPFCMKDQSRGFLKRYLQQYNSKPSRRNVTAVAMDNFLMLGDGDRTHDMVIDRINRMMTPNVTDSHCKPVYKTNCTVMVGIHNVKADACPGAFKVRLYPTELRMLHYWGSRTNITGLLKEEIKRKTVEFNLVRDTISKHVRESLLNFGEIDAFSNSTGP